MPEFREFSHFFQAMRWQDWVDILVVAFLIYQALRLIRGTRSMQMLLGLAVVLGAYFFSDEFDLLTLNWVLSNFLTYIILILVILFQADIRRALTQVARNPFTRTNPEFLSIIGEVSRAAFIMAERLGIGALIAFEREIGLKNYIEAGTVLDSKVSIGLLLSIFNTTSPLHDGAAIIQGGRVAATACFLPLTADQDVSRSLGTRHRAAIGLTQETDAAVIVVSEETSEVSLVLDGKVSVIPSQNELRDALIRLLHLTGSIRRTVEEES